MEQKSCHEFRYIKVMKRTEKLAQSDELTPPGSSVDVQSVLAYYVRVSLVTKMAERHGNKVMFSRELAVEDMLIWLR